MGSMQFSSSAIDITPNPSPLSEPGAPEYRRKGTITAIKIGGVVIDNTDGSITVFPEDATIQPFKVSEYWHRKQFRGSSADMGYIIRYEMAQGDNWISSHSLDFFFERVED